MNMKSEPHLRLAFFYAHKFEQRGVEDVAPYKICF